VVVAGPRLRMESVGRGDRAGGGGVLECVKIWEWRVATCRPIPKKRHRRHNKSA
jgi:hypothetical protein